MKRPRLLFISNLFPDETERYRGLDNATVLHRLSDSWEIRVLALRPTLKAWLSSGKESWNPRSGDEIFAPNFVPVRYVPRIGDLVNHQLMERALENAMEVQRGKQEFDVVMASWLYPDGWAAAALAKKLGLPLVLIAQGSDVHRYLKVARRRTLILEAVEQSVAVITRSKSLARLLEAAGVPNEKLKPVANGVDSKVFHRNGLGGERENRGLGGEAKVVLFVGNLLPVKNPGLLVRAFGEVVRARPEWRMQLLIAGKGPMEKELKELVEKLGMAGQVTFLGPLPAVEIGERMRAADLLCLSSRNEGLPNVVLESMACGLPVLATDVGGIHEVVDEPWKGLLTPEDDVEAFAQAMEKLLETPLDGKRIAEYGGTLSWERTAAVYQSVLETAVESDSEKSFQLKS
ncbi:glycosyltransferase family 4 protein [Phragmitibacter flavus]|uniref:Glycosyltransferase family 4 protein n=1 Tax=Phragmitibacter flavus TaxID=2576071 RepID=A0A5R8KAD6_9BACT|nr:glycosyltransferase [Phragmitibacter flavus]TLD69280.1 glycosyltransferase family 4 protein [Phragmitibacter flavus]